MKDRYIQMAALGKGGFGTTYLVEDKQTMLKYAMKHISYSSPEELQNIKKEFSLMSELSHPNVVQCYECEEDGKICRIRMEYAAGGDLSHEIRSGMTSEQIRFAVCQVLLALDYLHQTKHVMHRDIKQHNILVNNGLYQICDFGMSKILMNTNADARTRCGTPMFFAPEIVSGRKYTSKCDIWSCGVMLYFMLKKRYPFDGSSANEVFKAILRCGEQIEVDYPESAQLAELARMMLVKNPESRPTARNILVSGLLDNELRYLLKAFARKKLGAACQQIRDIEDRILPVAPELKQFVDPRVMERKAGLIEAIGQAKFDYIVTQLSLGRFLSEAAQGLSLEHKLLFKGYIEFIIGRRRAGAEE